MKLSRKWLTEFVDLPLSEVGDRDFDEAMTISGSKVEVTEDLSATIRNVKVGRVLSMEKHPNSDHMYVCQLDVGEAEPVQIVTGAWNVHVGDLVPAALHKSLLPSGAKIEKGKLRGVASFGMLCSLKELNLTEHDYAYAVIEAAAILGDYHPIDPLKPSISPLIKAGDRICRRSRTGGASSARCCAPAGGCGSRCRAASRCRARRRCGSRRCPCWLGRAGCPPWR